MSTPASELPIAGTPATRHADQQISATAPLQWVKQDLQDFGHAPALDLFESFSADGR